MGFAAGVRRRGRRGRGGGGGDGGDGGGGGLGGGGRGGQGAEGDADRLGQGDDGKEGGRGNPAGFYLPQRLDRDAGQGGDLHHAALAPGLAQHGTQALPAGAFFGGEHRPDHGVIIIPV